jgi:hypothetical protein
LRAPKRFMGKTQDRIQQISEKLSGDFQRLVPLRPEKGKSGKRPSDEDIRHTSAAALKTFYEEARRERLSHGLGVFGRARVALALQQRLLSAGYPAALVKQVLFAMLTAAFVGDKR